MLVKHLQSLRAHGEWADAQLLKAVAAATALAPLVRRELAHVRGAQEAWLSRIDGRPATIPIWPEFALADLQRAGTDLDSAMRALFDGLTTGSLEREVAYTNTAGQSFVTPLGEILLHLLTHGQYHRGKANAALRAAGLEPAGVDYIAWQREVQRAAADGRAD